MGNVASDVGACCSAERGSYGRNEMIDMDGTFVVYKHTRPGKAVLIAFTEWEEIIALSRAFAPGGKLLGLSSTKKIIASLHELFDEEDASFVGFELNVWELHRADRGMLNASKKAGDIAQTALHKQSTGAATPKLENSVCCYPLSGAPGLEGKARVPIQMKNVLEIAFLDSAEPRFLAGAISYAKGAKVSEDPSSGVTVHGVKVWRIQAARRVWDESMVVDEWRGSPNNPKSPRRGARRELFEVAEITHGNEISAFCQLRQFIFIGDISGTLQGFFWENWTDSEWRRVSRSKKQGASRMGKAGGKEQLVPRFKAMRAEMKAHGSEYPIVSLESTCGGGKTILYSAGQNASGIFTVRIWRVSAARIDLLGDQIELSELSLVTHLKLGQTPDVGASWYAPSHGHHKLEAAKNVNSPKTSRRKSNEDGGAKKDSKRERGMRPHLPPFLFIAGTNKNNEHVMSKWLVREGCVPARRMSFKPAPSAIKTIAFGPYNNGPLITGTESGTLLVWDSARGTIQQTLSGPTGCINGIIVEPNAHAWTIADDGNGDGNIMAWRLDGQGVKF